MRKRLFGSSLHAFAATLLAAAPAAGQGTGMPGGIDCASAASRVEAAICQSDYLRDLDRDVQRFVLAVRTTLAPEQARGVEQAQLNWQRQRDQQCSRVVGDVDPTGPVYRCLVALYRARLLQLATQSDRVRAAQGQPAISGYYRHSDGRTLGELHLFQWPEAAVTVLIDTRLLPDAEQCFMRVDMPGGGPVLEGAANGAPECRVRIAVAGRTATVSSANCQALCVLNGTVDGVYQR
jgi:uncharacterized protein